MKKAKSTEKDFRNYNPEKVRLKTTLVLAIESKFLKLSPPWLTQLRKMTIV